MEKIGAMPDNVFTTGTKARLIAESHFLRAWFNFRITMLWNEAPLVTHTLSLSNLYVPKSPRQAFFDLIEQDLLSADSVLPVSYGAADVTKRQLN